MTDTKTKYIKLDDTKPWRNWVFTFNNFTKKNITDIQSIDETVCKYIIYGEEIGESKTPHLQGYIEFHKTQRQTAVKKLLDPSLGKKSPIHVEPANADRFFNKMYCSKGMQPHEEYNQLGDKGPNYGLNAKIYERTFKETNEGRGKRTDWDKVYNRITEEPDFATILQEFPEKAIKYPNGIQKAIDTVIQSKNKESLTREMNDLRLYTWETHLINKLEQTPDKRKIMWYVDKIGGCGKSTFAKYLLSKGNCTYFTNAKSADIAHAYKGERTVIFDFTRSIEGRINYEIIEAIKNGIVFAPKYSSGLKVNPTPHIICFSNFDPEQGKLSQDRWDLTYLSEEDKSYPSPDSNDSDEANIINSDCMNTDSHKEDTASSELSSYPDDNIMDLEDNTENVILGQALRPFSVINNDELYTIIEDLNSLQLTQNKLNRAGYAGPPDAGRHPAPRALNI